MPHSGTSFAPNEISDSDVEKYIEKKQCEIDIKKALFHLEEGTKLRSLMLYKHLEKRRYNLSKEYMKVDNVQRSVYLFKRDEEDNVEQY
jgi:hypothetical protein